MGKVTTWSSLQALVQAGKGQGIFENYQPWLWVHRRNPSKKGNQFVDTMPGYKRQFHFLSTLERSFGLLALWLGASDIREQFPIFPWSHDHPLLPYDPANIRFQKCRGLVEFAAELGIDHGWAIGSHRHKRVPYVATIDLMLAVPALGQPRAVFWECKPTSEIFDININPRTVERIRLTNAYAKHYEIKHVVVHGAMLGLSLAANLEVMSGGYSLPKNLTSRELKLEFAQICQLTALDSSIDRGIREAANRLRLHYEDANLMWRHLCWHRDINVDMTSLIDMTAPLMPGSMELYTALQGELIGEVV